MEDRAMGLVSEMLDPAVVLRRRESLPRLGQRSADTF